MRNNNESRDWIWKWCWALFLFFSLSAPSRGELAWQQTTKTFQRVPSDGSVEARFDFENVGEKPVSISRVTSSCGCTAAQVDRNTFGPGETGEIKAVFTIGDRRGIQKKLVHVSTDDGKTQSLELVVTIEELVAVAPTLLFWRVNEPAEPKESVVRISRDANVKIRSIKCSNPSISADLIPLVDGPGYKVKVTPKATTERLSSMIIIQTDFPVDAPRSYSLYVRVK